MFYTSEPFNSTRTARLKNLNKRTASVRDNVAPPMSRGIQTLLGLKYRADVHVTYILYL